MAGGHGQFARQSSANRYCPSSARYRRLVRRAYYIFLLRYSLKSLVSFLCRGLRLYLPTGGRWLGAQPQDGGSQRAGNQFNHRRRNFPGAIISCVPLQESTRYNRHRVSIPTSKYHPQIKPSAYRPQAPSVTPPACQLPPGGSYGACALPHWTFVNRKCLL